MDTLFVLQMNGDGVLDDAAAAVYNAVCFQRWFRGKSPYSCCFSQNGETLSLTTDCRRQYVVGKDVRRIIPVGSLEFCERFTGKRVTPLNIPAELMDEQFTHRKCAYIHGNKIADIFPECDKLFVKNADVAKDDTVETGVFDRAYLRALSDCPSRLFVSEPVDFISEWRCFIYRGKLLYIACYSGDEWMLPDKQSVIDMTTAFSSAPDAYTLDVGILSTGGTAVVEVHNFVSCGLYGFGANNAEDLIHMVIAGYRNWIEKPENNKKGC